MKTRIQKWGNSLAIRIPKAFATEIGLLENSTVEVILNDDELVITPAKERYVLKSLVKEITKENRHGEEDFGEPEGGEVW